MKQLVLLLALASLCAVAVGCQKDRANDHAESTTAAITFEEAIIDYRDYTDAELLTVKNLLLERMEELGIQALGIGDDVVDITVYEVSDALEAYLVSEILPTYKSGIVRISILPEGSVIRLT